MKKKFILLTAFVLLVFAGGWVFKELLKSASPAGRTLAGSQNLGAVRCGRIISLAPSITETLFTLGLGDRLVGVTRFCDYPPEALDIVKVGGYFDPNYEAIVALKSDLVIMLEEHDEPKVYLSELGIDVLVVNHKGIPGILDSIITIGKICGVEEKAGGILADIETRMDRVKNKTEGLPRPRVMITVGRNMSSGSLKDAYIAGRDGFYDRMITLAGGVNAYTGRIKFPIVSNEGILQMNPEVIIDMVADLETGGWKKKAIMEEWESVSGVEAVIRNHVYVFGQGYIVVPGPRFIRILEEMARAIHPEVEWE